MATTPEDEAAIDEFVSRHLDDIENVISEIEKDVLRLRFGYCKYFLYRREVLWPLSLMVIPTHQWLHSEW